MNRLNIYPVICFSAFVLWLLSITMDGPLLQAVGILDAANFFLPAHILSLLIIGLFCPSDLFKRLAPPNCILTALLTLVIPMVDPSVSGYILMAAGACGAFVAIDACVSLRQSSAPLLSAVYGLAAANILFLPIGLWPDGGMLLFAATALPVAVIPVLTKRLRGVAGNPNAENLWRYLPFIFIFQIVSGLMYAFIIPAYHDLALLPGIDLLFYIAGVIAARHIVQKNRELAMVCGVMLGMAAFTILQGGYRPVLINMSMFAMMGGAGIIDLVLIAILLSFPEPVRAFGMGLAIFCSGILAGKMIGLYSTEMTGAFIITGHLVLNFSILTLYFLGRYYYHSKPWGIIDPSVAGNNPVIPAALVPAGFYPAHHTETESTRSPNGHIPTPNQTEIIDKIPDHLRLLLSERECDVFKRAISGHTYRETARELDISESTVKTYMGRIYEKMGVKSKKQLFEMLNNL